jgi:hypothetical protein
MPLKWEISPADRFVTVTAEGFVSLQDLEDYYDALVVADAMPYAKLFDLSAGGTEVSSDEDFMRFGARMSAYTPILEIGPLAFVVTSPEVQYLIRRCLNLAPADRPVKMFGTVGKARRWLAQQRGGVAA